MTKYKLVKKCQYVADIKRIPSNCDRIIYKSNNITFSDYGVISENEFDLIKLSDHRMIYGKFRFNNKNYLMLAWNINAFDKQFDNSYTNILQENVNILLSKYVTSDIDYIVVSLQEVNKQSLFIESLTNNIQKLNYNLVNKKSSNSYSSTYYVHLLVFSRYNKDVVTETGYSNFTGKKIEGFKDIINRLKTYLGTKSYVYATLNNEITFVSVHFPIDTKEIDLGNNLRIAAFEEIKNRFKNDNVIVAGDVNFRKIFGNDQLDTLLTSTINNGVFREAGVLDKVTCKFTNCGYHKHCTDNKCKFVFVDDKK